MSSYNEADPTMLIEKTAVELKKIETIKAPVWAVFVKTGVAKERAPENRDWWYVRSASILRAVGKLGPIGTSKLRTKYGSRKNRGVAPEHHYRASGAITRKILQQLEASGLIKHVVKGVHKGRILTPKGISLLHKTAKAITNG